MSTSRRIVKNTTTLFLSQTAYFISGLIIMTFAARILGVSDFGGFTFAVSLVAFIELTTNLGINLLIVREVAKDRENVQKYWGNILLIKIILVVISISVIIIITYLLGFEPKPVIFILAISQIFNSIIIFNYSFFQAFEKMEYQFYTTITEKLFISIMVILTLINGFGLLGLAVVFLVGRIIGFFVSMIIFSKGITGIKFKLDIQFIRAIILKALPFALFLVMGTIYFQMDSVLLSYFKGNKEVGYYQAAIRLIMVILLFPDVVIKSLLPVMSYYFKNSKEKLGEIFKLSYKYLIIIGMPISIGIYVLAKPIILLIFGEEYGLSVKILEILCWVIALRFMGFLPGLYLTVINQQKIRSYIVTSAAIVSVVLNLILIPRFGAIGASTTNLFCNIFVATTNIMLIQFKFSPVNMYEIFIKPLSALILAAVFLFFQNYLNVFVAIGCSFVTYISLLFLFGSIKKEELVMLIASFKR